MSLSSTGVASTPSSTVSPPLNQLQSGAVPPSTPTGSPAATGASAAFAGPTTFNVLAAPPATVATSAANGAPAAPGSGAGAPAGTGANPQQPGAGKTTQSGSNDGVSNDVSAALTAVGGSTDSAPGAASTTPPVSGAALATANTTYGHLNAYLSVYA
jgi:hypothetical protein